MAREEVGKHGAQKAPEHGLGVVIALVAIVFIASVSIIITDRIYSPNSPEVEIINAYLDELEYSNGHLSTKINLTVVVKYENAKFNNSCFDYLLFVLRFRFKTFVASLKVDASNVLRNRSQNYVLNSSNVSVHEYDMDAMDVALMEDRVPFFLRVGTNVKWRIGSLHFDSQDSSLYYLEFSNKSHVLLGTRFIF